jgi:hypothetical protein
LGQRLGLEATPERALALDWPAPEAAPEMAATPAGRHLLRLVSAVAERGMVLKAAGAIRRLFSMIAGMARALQL